MVTKGALMDWWLLPEEERTKYLCSRSPEELKVERDRFLKAIRVLINEVDEYVENVDQRKRPH